MNFQRREGSSREDEVLRSVNVAENRSRETELATACSTEGESGKEEG